MRTTALGKKWYAYWKYVQDLMDRYYTWPL